MKKITIFTPTYNRANTLEKVYQSLLNQTCKDFEWIIVDDGSTDNTYSIVKKWINKKEIEIKYYKQTNKGKMMAHNLGVDKSICELFTCVDSDDYLTEDAIKMILNTWNNINNKNCIGIVALKLYEDLKIVGNNMTDKVEYSKLIDIYNKYKHKGDLMLIYKTELLKKYKFPKIKKEKFIPEAYIYDKLDLEGKLFILNKGIYICNYLQDGYTKNYKNIIKNNPKGYVLYSKQRLEIAKSFPIKLKSAAQYIVGNWLAHEKMYIKNSKYKIILIISIPLAIFLYVYKFRK